jgi:hypothetical protein
LDKKDKEKEHKNTKHAHVNGGTLQLAYSAGAGAQKHL